MVGLATLELAVTGLMVRTRLLIAAIVEN